MSILPQWNKDQKYKTLKYIKKQWEKRHNEILCTNTKFVQINVLRQIENH